jgi:hypothetical protein
VRDTPAVTTAAGRLRGHAVEYADAERNGKRQSDANRDASDQDANLHGGHFSDGNLRAGGHEHARPAAGLGGHKCNNTDQPMIMPGLEAAFEFIFEDWDSFGEKDYHYIYKPFVVKPGIDAIYKRINCILYPEETGVISFQIETKILKEERAASLPYGPGIRLLSYQSHYRRMEDLKTKALFEEYPDELYEGFHPLAENLAYSIRGSAIFLNFDIGIYVPDYVALAGTQIPSWVVLYDKQGDIINILLSDPDWCTGYMCFKENTYHLYGIGSESWSQAWVTPGAMASYWEPMTHLTAEDLQRVDHIRVLTEIEDRKLCLYPIE